MTTEVQRVDAWLKEHEEEQIAFLRGLVQIPSEVTPPTGGNEWMCQRFVEQALRQAGANVDVFNLDEVPGLREHPAYFGLWDGLPRVLDNRPDVVGVFPGSGEDSGGQMLAGKASEDDETRPSGGHSLLFSTHVDTVPAGNPASWTQAAPFSGEIRDGRLYGRGSWDTKWGIAASLFAVRAARVVAPLRGDVIVESVSDEEFGGSHGTLAARLRGYTADFAINGEPTNMMVAPAHRGGTAWKITVRGDQGRGFSGQKLSNPVFKLARLIEAIQAYDRARSTMNQPPRFYEENPSLPTYIQQVNGGGSSFAESIGAPAECSLSLWIEEHPGVSEEEHSLAFQGFLNDFLARDPDFDGVFPEYLHQFRYLPGSVVDPDHPFFACLERSFTSTGLEYHTGGALFACDTYVFNLHSPTPALTLGPRGGNAHAPDEFVLVQDVLDLTRVYARAILEWCR